MAVALLGLVIALVPACGDNTGSGPDVAVVPDSSVPLQRCTNGVDDDGDGTTDCADTDCETNAACEPGFEQSCSDGFDNDGDGYVDCNDSNCNNVDGCEWVETLCNDGIDNEGDGDTDCADPDCSNCGGACCGVGFVCVADACQRECAAEETVCGEALDTCCGAGQVCLSNNCVTPGNPCTSNDDCSLTEVCEPVLGNCVPLGSTDICEYVPPVGVLDPIVGCRWTPPGFNEGNDTPFRSSVVVNPVVANLTDDNGDGVTNTFDIPDIAFVAWDADNGNGTYCCNEPSTLYVVSGKCNDDGTMQTHASLSALDLDDSGGLAVGDLDGDMIPEIVAMQLQGGSVAYKRDTPDGTQWSILWQNDDYPEYDKHTRAGAQPALADLNADGFPEVIIGNVALNGTDGSLLWDGTVTSGGDGGIGNNAFLGPVAHVADIDLDNRLEVIAGNTVYSWNGEVEWSYDTPAANSAGICSGQLPCDGFSASANFDDDDFGEVVIVRQGEIVILEHDGTEKVTIEVPWDNCEVDTNFGQRKVNESGPPTIADFDGDGRPEIGTAGADYYTVADLDCVGDPLPSECFAEYIRWAVPNQDCTSRSTASSVFDFEGDGRAEVIYADETRFRIFDGQTGALLYEDDTHGSITRLEMPVVADVDNDGNAEVIIPENFNFGGTPGLEVWRDNNDNWVRSRRIWNQHSYHISNISEDGIVPTYEQPNWLSVEGAAPQNNFRQNVQPEGLLWAPDLQVASVDVECGNELTVTACISNMGAIAVSEGLQVAAYISVSGGDPEPITTNEPLVVTSPLQAQGACVPIVFTFAPPDQVIFGEPFTITIEADVDGSANGQHNECIEDNNTLTYDGVCSS